MACVDKRFCRASARSCRRLAIARLFSRTHPQTMDSNKCATGRAVHPASSRDKNATGRIPNALPSFDTTTGHPSEKAGTSVAAKYRRIEKAAILRVRSSRIPEASSRAEFFRFAGRQSRTPIATRQSKNRRLWLPLSHKQPRSAPVRKRMKTTARAKGSERIFS